LLADELLAGPRRLQLGDDARDLVVRYLRPEPVGAEDQGVPGRDRHPLEVRPQEELAPDRASQNVPSRMIYQGLGFRQPQPDELGGLGMVVGELCQATIAAAVDAAIADVSEIARAAGQHQTRQSRLHRAVAGVLAGYLVHAQVGRLDRALERRLDARGA